jgi:hypothetical protein
MIIILSPFRSTESSFSICLELSSPFFQKRKLYQCAALVGIKTPKILTDRSSRLAPPLYTLRRVDERDVENRREALSLPPSAAYAST